MEILFTEGRSRRQRESHRHRARLGYPIVAEGVTCGRPRLTPTASTWRRRVGRPDPTPSASGVYENQTATDENCQRFVGQPDAVSGDGVSDATATMQGEAPRFLSSGTETTSSAPSFDRVT